MNFFHGENQYYLDDQWWIDADMYGFQPSKLAYRTANQHELVATNEVKPLLRQLSHGVFNDSEEDGLAKDRVVRILKGFRSDDAIPPVTVIALEGDGRSRYRLHCGAHRFYCSVAAKFIHVPAIVRSSETR